jgi:mono/diheme cytochrome c family protein
MKTIQKMTALFLTAMIAVVFLLSNTASAQQAKAKPWPVPDKYKAMKPTVKLNDATVITTGKDLWAKHCKSCHGTKGLGDGPKGASLKTNAGDFSSAAFQGQTDGEIYYKTAFGRDEMPSYEKKIPEISDHWALVAYMRTLKK